MLKNRNSHDGRLNDGAPEIGEMAGHASSQNPDLLAATLSSLGDGMISADAAGRVVTMNPVAQALTGWTQAEAVGHSLEIVFNIVNEKTRKAVDSPSARALRDNVVVGLANHTVLISRTGSERAIDHSAAPIRDSLGNATGVVLVFRDISERRHQESRTAEALAYSQAVLDTMRHGFIVLDGNLRVRSANAAFFRKFKVAEKDAVGRLVYELGAGEWNHPRLRNLLEEVLPSGRPFEDFGMELDTPGSGKRLLILNASRLRGEGPDGLILLTIEDVTDRNSAEHSLRVSEIRYRRLFQFAKDGILILDALNGQILDANAFMCGLLGQDLAELAGKELFEIGLFKDIEENKAMFAKLRSDGYVRYEHLPVQTPNGRSTSVEFVSNVYSEGDRLVAQCNVRDISERTRMEEQIALQSRALQEQNRRKDEFLAMLSHELRNPLAPILSATQLVKISMKESGSPDLRQACDVIERQVGHLTRIVGDLLEVSRVVSGRILIKLEPVDIREVVRHAVESAAPLAEHRKQKVKLTVPEKPVWVQADATRLEQVVVNLLDNSIKYTPEGGEIWLVLEESDGHAGLRVRDAGIGIAAEVLPCVFELFSQADKSLDRGQGGLGIGLNLVQRLTKLQGGTVEAHSDGLGKGSEFVVRLPLIAAPGTSATAPAGKAEHPAAGKLRVLVVDDNVDACNMLAKLLEQTGRIVQTAFTGPSALERALEWHPDVVLLDIGLPVMNGYEIARCIRKDPTMKNTRLVALTGYGTREDVLLARESGFDAHLLKPVDLAEVEKFFSGPRK